MDKIIIKGLKVHAYHGVNKEEKENGQLFIVNAELSTSLKNAALTDNVRDTISYSAASKLIVKTVRERSYDLLETVADRITLSLFNKFDKLNEVTVTLLKPQAPINLEFEYMGVEIHRKRSDYECMKQPLN